MKNKKGVSPLLAAVLLIAFSIVLAAIVSNFVIKKTKEFKPEVIAEESVYCDTVSLGYKINPDTYGIGNDLIEGIILVNKGTFSIYQLLINTPGLPSITVRLLDTADSSKETPISPSDYTDTTDIKENEYSIEKLQVGSSPEVKIIPIIKDSDTGNFVKCSNKELTINLLQITGSNGLATTSVDDTNNDGISDAWATENSIADITGDGDGDGLENFEEAILGTDPTTTNKIKNAENVEVLPPDANFNGITDTTEIGVMIQVIGTTS